VTEIERDVTDKKECEVTEVERQRYYRRRRSDVTKSWKDNEVAEIVRNRFDRDKKRQKRQYNKKDK
jgi:hypothetical protein